MSVNTNCPNCNNYTVDFLEDLKEQLKCKISNTASRDLINSKLFLNNKKPIIDSEDITLVSYIGILDEIIHCSSCYKDENIEDIVSEIKNKLNKC